MKLNTGAGSNCMSKTVFELLKYQPSSHHTNSVLSGYRSNRIAPIGVFPNLHHERRIYMKLNFVVVDGNEQALMGEVSFQHFYVVRRLDALNNSVLINTDTDAFITQFADA
jgi:hypothetical protein